MKKIICIFLFILILFFIPILVMAGSYRISVTSRIKALPNHPLRNAKEWTTNTHYTQGSYVRNYGEFFMAVVAGTSALAGTGPHSGYSTTNDNTVTWYCVPSGNRDGLFIQNISGGDLTVGFGDPFVTNSQGVVLNAGDDLFMQSGVFQGEVYLVSTGSTSTISEW